jgi:hypothetical protein
VTRKWLNEGNDARGAAGIRVLWPVIDSKDYQEALKAAEAGESPNNVSVILSYRTGATTFMWMGDLETDFMEKIANQANWPKVDILFASHHGRNSGRVPHSLLDQLRPRIIVIGEAPSRICTITVGMRPLHKTLLATSSLSATGTRCTSLLPKTRTRSATWIMRVCPAKAPTSGPLMCNKTHYRSITWVSASREAHG